jgi:hypothetical protein
MDPKRKMTYLAHLMRQHSAATAAMFACRMVYVTFKGSVDSCSLVQVVPTEAGTRAAHTRIAVSVSPIDVRARGF